MVPPRFFYLNVYGNCFSVLAKTGLKSAGTAAESEAPDDETDDGDKSKDRCRKRRRKLRITVNLAGTHYRVGKFLSIVSILCHERGVCKSAKPVISGLFERL